MQSAIFAVIAWLRRCCRVIREWLASPVYYCSSGTASIYPRLGCQAIQYGSFAGLFRAFICLEGGSWRIEKGRLLTHLRHL